MVLTIIAVSLVFLLLLYILSMIGRRNHPGLVALRSWNYAHRGLFGGTVPENSMEAFRFAKEAGYGVELDVHLLKDGNLAVFHDADLKRMTGKDGRIVDLTTEQLKEYPLNSTDQTIPEFRKVLNLFDGKVPLIVELKSVNNYADLCDKTCNMLDDYNGVYFVESVDPRCVRWLRKHRPDIIRGQLCQNYYKPNKANLPGILKFLLSNQMMNFLTMPDFVAYKFEDRKHISNWFARKLWKLQGVSWTIKSQEDLNMATQEGWIPIFEGFEP